MINNGQWMRRAIIEAHHHSDEFRGPRVRVEWNADRIDPQGLRACASGEKGDDGDAPDLDEVKPKYTTHCLCSSFRPSQIHR